MMNKKICRLTGFLLKSIIFTLFLAITIFTTCSLEGDIEAQRQKPAENNPPVIPANKTFIIFDNTQGICTVSVYEDYRRRDEDKIDEIPAGNNSAKIEWTPGTSVPFYFSYRVNIKDISGFILNYVAEMGRDQKAVRIDADITTTVKVPTLSETFSSPDTLLSNNSYLFIQNNSSFSFELHQGTSKIKPDNISSPLVNSGERAQYTINPGPASSYQLLLGATYYTFTDSTVSFEAGHIYIFDFNGSISLISDTVLKLENVNGITIPQSPAAPVVITSNGFITLQWTAVESATAYEIWMSTVNDSASALKYGTDVAASLFAVINDLNNGTKYYFWLKAKNNIGTSAFSPVATGTPSAYTVKPPDPQIAPSIIAGNGQLAVSWQTVEETDVYEIWAGGTNNTQTAIKRGEDVSGLSTVISDLNNGTTYYVWIKAKNNIGVSGFSPSATGKPLGTPGTPTLSSGYEQLLVTWSAVAGAEQYEVYYGIDTPITLATTTTATTATITGLTNGTVYYVRLRAKNVSGVSDYGLSASGVPIGNIGVVTVSSGNGQLSLSWSVVAGADEYEVYYSTTNSIPASPTQIISATSATISGLINGTTYYVWVKGKNANGANSVSSVVSGKPLGTPGTPTVSPGYERLLVTWTAVDGADEYEVYYGIGTPTTLAATTNGTTATVTELTVGTTYYIRLRAKNANGVSDYGQSASGVPNDDRTPGLYRGNDKIGNQNLADSLTYISTNAVSGDEFLIVIGANESIAPKTLNYSDKTVGVTLLGYDSEKTISLNTNGSMFTVNSGVTLTIDENITLVGRSANNASLVYVDGGDLIMNDGAKITGNTNHSSNSTVAYGGGVRMSGGTFMMNGGKIIGNTTTAPYSGSSLGGGVYMSGNNITFTMSGGEINGNNVTGIYNVSGGGVYMSGSNSTFMMSGGEISGNTATSGNTANSASYGGGVYCNTFTMNGGKISGNIATGGPNSASSGGGVYSSTFTMNNGEISGNTASGNTNLSGGGGVYNNGTFTMNDGKISGNTATLYGGGMFERGTFTMNGGEISSNTATTYGGGVYMDYYCTFTKSGGTITGYASDTVNGNVVKNSSGVIQNNRGHAVYGTSTIKRRESTAGLGVNLDSSVSGAAGGWE